MCNRLPFACIVPPHILEKLLESKERHVREAALKTLLTSTQIRSQRSLLAALPGVTTAGEKRRTIYDAKNLEPDPPSGTLARGEGAKAVKDAAVNEAYDGLGATYEFYREIFGRNSIDGKGCASTATVHYGERVRQRVLGRRSRWSSATATASCSTASPGRSTSSATS